MAQAVPLFARSPIIASVAMGEMLGVT